MENSISIYDFATYQNKSLIAKIQKLVDSRIQSATQAQTFMQKRLRWNKSLEKRYQKLLHFEYLLYLPEIVKNPNKMQRINLRMAISYYKYRIAVLKRTIQYI